MAQRQERAPAPFPGPPPGARWGGAVAGAAAQAQGWGPLLALSHDPWTINNEVINQFIISRLLNGHYIVTSETKNAKWFQNIARWRQNDIE